MPTRRALLTLAGTAIGSTAGCLSSIPGVTDSESNGDTVGVDLLAVQNYDDVSYDVTVVIEDGDGTQVFREELTVDGETSDGFEKPVDGKDAYTLRATVGTTTVREQLAEHIGDDVRCVIAFIRIRYDGEVIVRNRTYTRCADDEETE